MSSAIERILRQKNENQEKPKQEKNNNGGVLGELRKLRELTSGVGCDPSFIIEDDYPELSSTCPDVIFYFKRLAQSSRNMEEQVLELRETYGPMFNFASDDDKNLLYWGWLLNRVEEAQIAVAAENGKRLAKLAKSEPSPGFNI
ncbi:hypothetical protein KW795_01875 [Candidatus Microgenomates bacterium]|nr:hypothetical protein [Candidatus Microgenomates bacterium]